MRYVAKLVINGTTDPVDMTLTVEAENQQAAKDEVRRVARTVLKPSAMLYIAEINEVR